MREYLLTTNKYKKPYVLKDKDTLAVLLIRLLIMAPGTNPMHPEMGVDVMGRYRYCNKSDLQTLRQEIRDQIECYLMEYQSVEVEPVLSNGILKLNITIDDTIFKFTTDSNTAKDEISLVA